MKKARYITHGKERRNEDSLQQRAALALSSLLSSGHLNLLDYFLFALPRLILYPNAAATIAKTPPI